VNALKTIRFDRGIVGETIGVSTETVEEQSTIAYALATNDPNPAYLPGAEIIAPPLYQTRLAHRAMAREKMVELGLDVVGSRLGMHAEHDFSFFAPICPGETIVTEAKVAGVDDHRRGQIVKIQIESRTAAGEMRCGASMYVLFLDPESGRGSDATSTARTAAASEPPEPLATSRMAVTPDQSLRYADASRDHTPTHVDERVAKKFGFPTLLLQGLCTMAFAGKAVIDEIAHGDPTRLRRLRVRFTTPVFPGDVLTTSIWLGPTASAYRLETANQQGAQVIRDGIAELAPPSDTDRRGR
jgi:acyl dehydratase